MKKFQPHFEEVLRKLRKVQENKGKQKNGKNTEKTD